MPMKRGGWGIIQFLLGKFGLFSGIMLVPIGSMYGVFTYIYHKNQLNVGEYAIP